MKSILLLFVFVPFISFAQTNTFPSSGNVGIGTTTPGEKLEVQGHIKSTGWISTGSTSTSGYGGTSGYGILLPSTTNDYIRIFGEHDGSDYSNGVFLTGDNTNDGWIFRQSDCCGAGNLDYAKMARDQFHYIGGNFGIGTTTPGEKLEVQGHIKSTNWISTGGTPTSGYGGTSGYGILLPSTTNDYVRIFGEHDGSDYSNGVFLTGDNINDGWIFRQNDCCGAGNLDYAKMARDQFYYIGGNVGIGTTTPESKLAVNGDISSKKIKVTQTGWPDYVFHSSYKLLPLKDLETYIQQNTHLPEVPSANEVEKNGLNLGDNQAVLLKKIEELTLYIIQLHKNAEEQDRKIIELRDTNKKLEEQSKAIESLTKQVEALKSLLSNK